jgi:hypothetical protein
MVLIRIVGTRQICFDTLVGAACLEDVCCDLMGECAHCQLVTMFSSFLNLKNVNPFLYSVYILMSEFSFRRVCILKERSQK